MKQRDESISLHNRSFGRIEVRKAGWTDGEVVTPHGIVSIYAQGDGDHDSYSRLDLALGGRLYIRNFFGKRYTPRGLITKATQFASEISETCQQSRVGR